MEELRKLFMGLKTMDGPIPSHSDRGDAVKLGYLVGIKLPGLVVLVEEVRYLAFQCFRHGSPRTEAQYGIKVPR
jgi:hypothetical protein